jgi:transketolase
MLRRGAYVLDGDASAGDPEIILIASGSEVSLIVKAAELLKNVGIRARLVSMPSWRLFEEQTAEYRESVLPKAVTARLVVEAASPLGWERWTGLGGAVIGVDRFGASAPGATVLKDYGFTVEHVVAQALALAGRRKEGESS